MICFKRSPRRTVFIALLAGVSLLAVACSSGGSPAGASPGQTAAEVSQSSIPDTGAATQAQPTEEAEAARPGQNAQPSPGGGTPIFVDRIPFLLVVHAHLDEDYQPYLSEAMEEVDEDLLAGTISTIDRISGMLRQRELVANWQFSYGVASAMCDDPGGRALIEYLLESGDEIGIHTHGAGWMDDAYSALEDGCGISPTAASGLQFSVATSVDSPLNGATQWLEAVEDVGIHTAVSAVGLADSPLNSVCDTYDGATLDVDANALLHSWTVDPSDICTEDLLSDLAIVTHAGRNARSLSDVNTTLNDFSETDFDAWLENLRAALGTDDPTATWGIVMALPALMTDSGPNSSSMTALDDFLGEISPAGAGPGLPRLPYPIESMTASEAAAALGS